MFSGDSQTYLNLDILLPNVKEHYSLPTFVPQSGLQHINLLVINLLLSVDIPSLRAPQNQDWEYYSLH